MFAHESWEDDFGLSRIQAYIRTLAPRKEVGSPFIFRRRKEDRKDALNLQACGRISREFSKKKCSPKK